MRKKNSRQRGSTTHGWGSMKKHRGKGNKGGAGMAGTGKRGDAKNPSTWKKRYFGKLGFKVPKKYTKAINVSELETLLVEKKIQENSVDLRSMGYTKLLGSGVISQKLKISIDAASPKAVDKIKKAGGEILLIRSPIFSSLFPRAPPCENANLMPFLPYPFLGGESLKYFLYFLPFIHNIYSYNLFFLYYRLFGLYSLLLFFQANL